MQLTPTISSPRSNLVSAAMLSLKNTPSSRSNARTASEAPTHQTTPVPLPNTVGQASRPVVGRRLFSAHIRKPPANQRLSTSTHSSPTPASSKFQNDPNPISRHLVRQASRPVASTVQAANPQYKCGYPREPTHRHYSYIQPKGIPVSIMTLSTRDETCYHPCMP
jgi:hypothetical protein